MTSTSDGKYSYGPYRVLTNSSYGTTYSVFSPEDSVIRGTNYEPEKRTKVNNRDMAKRPKKVNIVTQEQRVIDTGLVNKEEVFKMLALAEATGLPLLLVGPPGVGKTKTVIEYAKAWLNRDRAMSMQDFMDKLFILETDEGTKSSEVKGMPDLSKLFTDNKYEIAAPIAEAEIVVINEVDKASSNVRNSLLGVMNERFLFNGKHKIPCKWKLFIATCNEIPKEEIDSPFWDRFMLKMTVNRVGAGDMLKYFNNGGRAYKNSVKINIPNKAEMDATNIISSKLEKYIDVAYGVCTDRTLTFAPGIAKAVSFIWNLSIDKALIKTADIMMDKKASANLMDLLISKEMKQMLKEIDNIYHIKDSAEIDAAIARIEGMASGYASTGSIDADQVDEVESALNFVLANHDIKKREKTIEDTLSKALESMEQMDSVRPF